MPKQAVLSKNGNGHQPSTEATNQELEENQQAKRVSPFLRGVTRAMIIEPHPLDFADGMDSLNFALERSCRTILRGRFESKREWIKFAEEMWTWEQGAADRESKAIAKSLLAKLASLLARNSENPRVNEEFRKEAAELLGLSPGIPDVNG